MRIVVAGASSAVGAAALPILVGAGHEVVALRPDGHRSLGRPRGGVESVPADIFDRARLVEALAGADAVVNLASAVPAGLAASSPLAWRSADRLRDEGALTLVEAAREAGVRRLVQHGTSVVYADAGSAWVTEESPLAITPATDAPATAEAHVQDYARHACTGVVLRLGAVVGPGLAGRLWLVHRLQEARAHGEESWAHVVHVDDVGPAVLAALHAPSGVYNVGAEPVRRAEVAAVMAAADLEGRPHERLRGALAQRLAPTRLEPLSRSLRVSSEHFAAQTGWAPTRPRLAADWLRPAEHRVASDR